MPHSHASLSNVEGESARKRQRHRTCWSRSAVLRHTSQSRGMLHSLFSNHVHESFLLCGARFGATSTGRSSVVAAAALELLPSTSVICVSILKVDAIFTIDPGGKIASRYRYWKSLSLSSNGITYCHVLALTLTTTPLPTTVVALAKLRVTQALNARLSKLPAALDELPFRLEELLAQLRPALERERRPRSQRPVEPTLSAFAPRLLPSCRGTHTTSERLVVDCNKYRSYTGFERRLVPCRTRELSHAFRITTVMSMTASAPKQRYSATIALLRGPIRPNGDWQIRSRMASVRPGDSHAATQRQPSAPRQVSPLGTLLVSMKVCRQRSLQPRQVSSDAEQYVKLALGK